MMKIYGKKFENWGQFSLTNLTSNFWGHILFPEMILALMSENHLFWIRLIFVKTVSVFSCRQIVILCYFLSLFVFLLLICRSFAKSRSVQLSIGRLVCGHATLSVLLIVKIKNLTSVEFKSTMLYCQFLGLCYFSPVPSEVFNSNVTQYHVYITNSMHLL